MHTFGIESLADQLLKWGCAAKGYRVRACTSISLLAIYHDVAVFRMTLIKLMPKSSPVHLA